MPLSRLDQYSTFLWSFPQRIGGDNLLLPSFRHVVEEPVAALKVHLRAPG